MRVGKILLSVLGLAIFAIAIGVFCTKKQGTREDSLYPLEQFWEDASKIYSDIADFALKRGNFEKAIKSFQEIVTTRPAWLTGYDRLGITYELNNQPNEALAIYAQAMAVNPTFTEYRLAPAHRIKPIDRTFLAKLAGSTAWTGQDLTGKKIFVFAEQSFSDTIMFSRFLKKLSTKAGKVYFKPQDPLLSLMKNSFPEVALCSNATDLSTLIVDFHVPLLSLPHYLGISLDDLNTDSAYLKARREKIETFSKEISGPGLKVGLAWQGDKNYINDKNRSIALERLYPILRTRGVKFYSLQKGFGTEQLEKLPSGVTIVNLAEKCNDFSDTAAAIENLDVVISIDSAVAHLSGALNKPTLLLTPTTTDWRWLGFWEKNSSAWYGSFKKVRQQDDKKWNKTIIMASAEFFKDF